MDKTYKLSFWKNYFELNFSMYVRDVEASVVLYFKTLSLEQGRTGSAAYQFITLENMN